MGLNTHNTHIHPMSTNKIWKYEYDLGITSMSISWLWYHPIVLQNVTIGRNWAKCTRNLYYFLQLHVNSQLLQYKFQIKKKLPLPWASGVEPQPWPSSTLSISFLQRAMEGAQLEVRWFQFQSILCLTACLWVVLLLFLSES